MSIRFLQHLAEREAAESDLRSRSNAAAERIYAGCNPVQRGPIDSIIGGCQYLGIRCPRRSGKSFCLCSIGLWYGEQFPGSRILIISLTLKTTRENYWSGAPGGIFRQDSLYGLGLKFNHTDSVWMHENGSRGRLAGAETRADMEYLRGAAAEADIAIVDECKSFAPDLLNELIRDVLEPGLMTRNGVLILAGTPGSIPTGPFYEATCESNRNDQGHPTCVRVGEEDAPAYRDLDPEYRSNLWKLHTWTLADNAAVEKKNSQWRRALRNKVRSGWSDDHPSWRREYLGEWVTDASDLVYSWAGLKGTTDVTWNPTPTRDNPSGLPDKDGPWHFVLGIDLGFVDDSALVLAAYSEQLRELRHVYDFKAPGMTVDDFAEEVIHVIEKYGMPEAIVADTAGGGSKMVIETLNARYGVGIVPAEKRDKQDAIELVNSDFHAGRLKIIPGSDLAHELAGLQWDLSRDSKIMLARTGRLREDPACPNHLCDAMLYMHRFAYHFWSIPRVSGPEKNTEAWWAEMERKAIENAVARKRQGIRDPHGLLKYASEHQDTAGAIKLWN